MMNIYPEFFARFYDLIYHSVRDSVDNDFFQNEIRQAKGRVLEIGAGTGRLFSEALTGGADIYGLDLSPSMLAVLKKKLSANAMHRVSQQNMIDFKYDFKFNLIIAPFRVIMHLSEKEDQIRALNNVYDHLETDGMFIFDVFIPDLKQLINGLKDVVDFEGEYQPGKKMKRIVSTRPDLINQLINIEFKIEWEEDEGIKKEVWNTQMRFFFRFELEHLIERSHFGKYKILGDYIYNDLNKSSKEFVVICRK
jgi:SAM-dependent methyltransferase